jgi:hypothetical protein
VILPGRKARTSGLSEIVLSSTTTVAARIRNLHSGLSFAIDQSADADYDCAYRDSFI